MDTKIAVITGASSGIGRDTARALLEKGYTVYNLSRRPSGEAGLIDLPCDVGEEAAVRAAFAEIASRSGHVDLLLCNAGFGISGAVEFSEEADAERLFSVNFFGAFRCIKAALPLLRGGRDGKPAGRILVTSSVAAVFAIPFQAFYSASKAAVTMLAYALSNELAPFGIQVCAALMGDVKTGFTDAREKGSAGDDLYGGLISRSVSAMEEDERSGMSSEAAGRALCRLAERRKMPLRCVVGGKYKLFVFLSRILPQGAQNRLVGLLYR